MRAQMVATSFAPRMNMAGLWFAFLEADGQRIAANLNFDYNNKLWGYNSGVRPRLYGPFPRLGFAGYVLQWAVKTNALNLISCAAMKNTNIALGQSINM